MNFNRYFIASSYSLLAASFAILAATRHVDVLWLMGFVVVMLAGCLIDLNRLQWNVPRRLANGLMIAWLGVAFVEWQLFRLPPVSITTHFVLFASSLKLLKQKTNRDWLWLYVVSFCIVLMSAGLMIGTTFLFLLMCYLLAAVSTFIAFEIRRTQQIFLEEVKKPELAIELWREVNDQRRPLLKPRAFGLLTFSVLALATILILAAPLFLVVPRITRNSARNSFMEGDSISGFSDTVRLGEVARVKLNPQVVMRVRVSFPRNGAEQQSAEQLRWRGVTLDRYDGQSWNNIGPDPVPIRRSGESFYLEVPNWVNGFTEQQFFMEPLNINTVFAAPRPLVVIGVPELSRDMGDALWTETHRFNKLSYSVYSDTSVPSDLQLAEDNSREYLRSVNQRYLQLPDNHDSRIDQLAVQVTEGAKTQIEIARRIEQHLRTQYEYSLDLRQVENGDPVADFLFNTRAGHCEYFASAMVLMLRARRIPARIVNGFQAGEYNRTADVFTVRQSDAHSWVEVYFPQHKWVAFDPTPSAGLSDYDDGLMAWMRQYSEAFEMFWLEEIVSFDTTKQISMVVAAQSMFSSFQFNASRQWARWTRRFTNWLDAPPVASNEPAVQNTNHEPSNYDLLRPAATPLALVLLLIGAAVTVLFLIKRWWLGNSTAGASRPGVKFYADMLRVLERLGHSRQRHQTPNEFAAELNIPAVAELTQLYQQARFGNAVLTAEESSRIESLLEELKRRSREKK